MPQLAAGRCSYRAMVYQELLSVNRGLDQHLWRHWGKKLAGHERLLDQELLTGFPKHICQHWAEIGKALGGLRQAIQQGQRFSV